MENNGAKIRRAKAFALAAVTVLTAMSMGTVDVKAASVDQSSTDGKNASMRYQLIKEDGTELVGQYHVGKLEETCQT